MLLVEGSALLVWRCYVTYHKGHNSCNYAEPAFVSVLMRWSVEATSLRMTTVTESRLIQVRLSVSDSSQTCKKTHLKASAKSAHKMLIFFNNKLWPLSDILYIYCLFFHKKNWHTILWLFHEIFDIVNYERSSFFTLYTILRLFKWLLMIFVDILYY